MGKLSCYAKLAMAIGYSYGGVLWKWIFFGEVAAMAISYGYGGDLWKWISKRESEAMVGFYQNGL